MNSNAQSKVFDRSAYYFAILLLVAIGGFWPSYFSKLLFGTADFNLYFHFHAVTAVVWIALLITQPILIRTKQLKWHRFLGRCSYIVIPLIFISVVLLAHHCISEEEANLSLSLWVPFKDLFILAVSYGIAIRYRHTVQIHARGMIATGFVLIEPALIRLIMHTCSGIGSAGYLLTIGIIYSLFITFIIIEWKAKKGRWVFPLILGLYVFVHSVIVFRIDIAPWQMFANWFASLPLT